MPRPHEMRLYDVDELDEGFTGLPRTNRQANTEKHYVHVEIGNRLGRLGMTRSGELAGIELDEQVLRTTCPAAVGASLVEAFHAAVNEVRRRPQGETRHA